jgi:Flp pilus assembly protein TadG
MVVLVAVAIVIFLVCVVFSIDIAFMHLTRTELRTAVDAAARAAAESLSTSQNTATATRAAQDTARQNLVAGRPFNLPGADVEFGRVDVALAGASAFDPSRSPPNAVRVISGRTSGRPDGVVPLFVGRLLGRDHFEPMSSAVAAQLDRDIALVMDVSGSMAEDNKFRGLQDAMTVFMAEINRTPQLEHVSLVTYSTTSTKDQALTPDMTLIASAFARKSPRGFTAIGLGLQDGLRSLASDPLRRPFAEPIVVLMTDGIHNTGVDPETIARTAPNNVTIHTITFGRDAEQARMIRVRDISRSKGNPDAQHFHAPDNARLRQIFRQIAATLPVVLTE